MVPAARRRCQIRRVAPARTGCLTRKTSVRRVRGPPDPPSSRSDRRLRRSSNSTTTSRSSRAARRRMRVLWLARLRDQLPTRRPPADRIPVACTCEPVLGETISPASGNRRPVRPSAYWCPPSRSDRIAASRE
jgi:hypothetical protein